MTHAQRKIALVTGANQGIGRALVDSLATRLSPQDVVLLTGRNAERVTAAAAALDGMTGRAQVVGRVLDVTDRVAVAELADELAARYGGVDIVVSNAIGPLVPERTQAEQVDEFLAVANGGTDAVLRSFGAVLRPGGRLIVVASSLGTLDHLGLAVRDRFDGASLEQIDAAVEQYRRAVHAGTAVERGWPDWINIVSKVAQVAAVRAVAAERRTADLASGTVVAAVCPGLVDTRASRPWFDDFSHARTPAAAVEPLLDFVLRPADPATYGELVRDGEVLSWKPA
ncbi:SDR family NAD(P)-dependent oxidoreductase [Kribbella sp. CA-253562]|uniref:SDR family NAD(P)-dependent oxidoreductase n=1 Tax=Kribbella sp. CA-253562 TaxID=3239942 RepID=UPI003D9260C4